MSDCVVMPKADWEDILNATREKAGVTDLMLSSQVASKIRSIAAEETACEYDLTVSFFDAYNSEMPRTGYYKVNGGVARYFESEKIITLIDAVNSYSVVELIFFDAGSPSSGGENCTADCYIEYVDIDGNETPVGVCKMQNFTNDATVNIYEG